MKIKREIFKRLDSAFKVLTGKSKAISLSHKLVQTPYHCPVCKKDNVRFDPLSFNYFREFDKSQFIHSIFQFETINLEFYSCSNCFASDRDRLYALYFDRIATNEKIKILDIAPAPALTKFLRAHESFTIRTADLFMKGVDDIVDITNMAAYADEYFDVFICSHVLEHIENDIAAMKELYRVLKKGGWGITMVPINLALNEIYEDYSIKDEVLRWKHFGQNDHVRMYSKSGFISRLESVGFRVRQFDISYFGIDVFMKHGIHPRSVLYVVSK